MRTLKMSHRAGMEYYNHLKDGSSVSKWYDRLFLIAVYPLIFASGFDLCCLVEKLEPLGRKELTA